MPYKVNILIEKDQDGFYAYCPELPGCQSQGDTLAEATEHMNEAVELYLETLSEFPRTTIDPEFKVPLPGELPCIHKSSKPPTSPNSGGL
jgi:predicted RNase H-like HicB family nuclease